MALRSVLIVFRIWLTLLDTEAQSQCTLGAWTAWAYQYTPSCGHPLYLRTRTVSNDSCGASSDLMLFPIGANPPCSPAAPQPCYSGGPAAFVGPINAAWGNSYPALHSYVFGTYNSADNCLNYCGSLGQPVAGPECQDGCSCSDQFYDAFTPMSLEACSCPANTSQQCGGGCSCGGPGQWIAYCTPYCSLVTTPTNGSQAVIGGFGFSNATNSSYFPATVIGFACDAGFSLVGPNSTQCMASTGAYGTTPVANWSPSTIPTCQSNCAIPTIANGNATPSTPCSIGNCNLSYACDPGYVLNGSSVAACVQQNATSVPSTIPTCIAGYCGALTAPANGTITAGTLAQNVFGTNATYTCNPCFTLQGSAQTTCSQPTPNLALMWSPTPTAYCSGQPSLCQNVFNTTVGTVTPGPYLWATSYTFTCLPEYSMAPSMPGVTSKTYNCSCVGQWDSPFVPCRLSESCPTLSVANGYATHYTSPSLKVGSLVYWTCNPGYIGSGDSPLTCASDLTWTWTTAQPTCTDGASEVAVFAALLPSYTASQVSSILGLNAVADALALNTMTLDAMAYILGSLTGEQLSALSYSIQDLLLDCQFRGAHCKPSDFILGVQDSTLGNCFTFNHLNMTQPYFELRPGEEQGLYLALNVEREEYLSIAPKAGMNIIVCDQHDLLLPDVMGFNVMPGTMTSLILRLTTISRFNSPHSTCISGVSDLAGATPYYYTAAYSTEACLRSAVQQALVSSCGCASPHYAVPPGNSVKVCNLSELICANTFLALKGHQVMDEAFPNCPQACVTQQFDASRVFALTTSLSSVGYCSAIAPNSTLDCSDFSKSDLVLLRVYFQSLFHVSLTEFRAGAVNDLIANCGGLTLMFAGMSVISCVEAAIIIGEGIYFLLAYNFGHKLAPQ